ncbi:two-component system regulatory protein YycI, partial [Enterococcus faecium]
MDFKKIEWIFFVAFLGLNVFLFSSYHDAVYQENNVIRSNQTESIQQRLASDDITYTGKISSENKQGYYLSAEQTNLSTSLANYRKAGKSGLLASGVFLDGDVLTKSLSSSDAEKNVIDPDKISSSLEDFLSNKDNILFGNDYVYTKNFSHLEEEPLEIQASQEYEGIPFNDDTAKIVLSLEKNDNDYSITKYMQTHLSDIEQL